MTIKLQHFGTAPRNDQGYIADRNLYLDAEGNLVEEDNPAQVRQLVGKGGALSTADAEKYGLLSKVAQDDAEAEPEAEAETEPETEPESSSPKSKETKTKGAK